MRYLTVDIETAPHPCAVDFVEKPDLEHVVPNGSLKDPEKIAADIAKKRAALEADYLESLNRAALDWNVSRIVAIGWCVDDEPIEGGAVADDSEQAEIALLTEFWRAFRYGYMKLLGFRVRTFDAPTIVQRSRLLGIAHPEISIQPFGRGDVLDLYDKLTFDMARRDAQLMPCSLKTFARRFGLSVEDEIDGAAIGALVAAGDYDAVWRHCQSDVALTRALAQRLGIVRQAQPAEVL